MQKVTPFLMFSANLKEAIDFYQKVFKDAKIETPAVSGERLQSATFELGGQKFMAFEAGGDHFKFTDAISLYVDCEDQAEVDYFWGAFMEGGSTPTQCGWLNDPFGISWQIVPKALNECLSGSDPEGVQRAIKAMEGMIKLDVEGLKKAYAGTAN